MVTYTALLCGRLVFECFKGRQTQTFIMSSSELYMLPGTLSSFLLFDKNL